MDGRVRWVVQLAWIVPVLAVLAVIGSATMRTIQPGSLVGALARGEHPPAPPFLLPRLGGGTLDLANLRGRAIVVNFWASWCAPCREEAPLLERVNRTYQDRGVIVIGINIQDLESEAQEFVTQTGITYPNLRDSDGQVKKLYTVTGVPETFFIDREGRVVKKFPGAITEWKIWQDTVEATLRSGL